MEKVIDITGGGMGLPKRSNIDDNYVVIDGFDLIFYGLKFFFVIT